MQFTLYAQNILMENYQPVDGFRIRFLTLKMMKNNCNVTLYRLFRCQTLHSVDYKT